MKKLTTFFALTIFTLTLLAPFCFNINSASAQTGTYSIQNVEHQIEVMYSGHLIISDKVYLTGQATSDFLIGFPKRYGAQVLKGIAYDENGMLPISLSVPFEDHNDLYAAKVSFPQATPEVFTVVFILSNDLTHQNNSLNAAAIEFPAYPSLPKNAGNCNVKLILPDFASNMLLTKNDGILTTNTYNKVNLPAFTSSPANVTFTIPIGILQIFSTPTLNRQITMNPAGDVTVSDAYRVINNGNESLVAFGADIPLNAANIAAKSDLGRNLDVEDLGTGDTFQLINVTLAASVPKNQFAQLTIEYTLPKVTSEQITNFNLNFELFPYFDYYINDVSVTIIPPEGAQFITTDPTATINKDDLQETLIISKTGVSHIDLDIPSETTQITYSYNPLWLSLRPTLWMWLIAAIGLIAIAVWRRPKTAAPTETTTSKPSTSRSSTNTQTFTESYEEKKRINTELKLLGARAQKNRIPRRQYKLQKRKLTARLATLSKEISEAKTILRGVNSNCASLIRELDLAEVELNKAETDHSDAESRFKSGAVSVEEHKKLLADCQRRKDKATATINGILLRLREETR